MYRNVELNARPKVLAVLSITPLLIAEGSVVVFRSWPLGFPNVKLHQVLGQSAKCRKPLAAVVV